ncbi:MAG: shikimate kinase [Lachnospiraceae bacterium]|nr:shikimate kinase [Lachnospiraceae bacterium]
MVLYITGFMGTGKTTVSKQLGETLPAYTVYDTDQEIEKKEGRAIKDIFATEGEEYFRRAETEILRSLSEEKNVIISCGGGIVLKEENRLIMKEKGHVILLTSTPETILKRTCMNDRRPLLKNKKTPEEIKKMMQEREAAYKEAADYTISTDDGNVYSTVQMITDYMMTV